MAAVPMRTRVRMSAREGSAVARVVMVRRSSGRVIAVAKTIGVVGGRMGRRASRAAWSCQGRALEAGL